jgi:hypothetical protein
MKTRMKVEAGSASRIVRVRAGFATFAVLALGACGAAGDSPASEEGVGERAGAEPACARPDGYVRALAIPETPPGFRAGDEPVSEPGPFDPRLAFRIVEGAAIEAGLLVLTVALANPTDEELAVDVITGGVPGLTSLPIAIGLDPAPAFRPGLGFETFTGPEVYPAAVRWTMPAGAELRMTVRECLARYDLRPGTRLRVHYSLATPGDSSPGGTTDVTVP